MAMLITEFFLDKEGYKKLNLQSRFIYDMVAYKANYIFHDTVIDILVKQNPDYRKDPDTYCQVEEFRQGRETAWEAGYRLKKLYESEWGELTEEVNSFIENSAKIYAEIPLDKFGWNKRKEELNVEYSVTT